MYKRKKISTTAVLLAVLFSPAITISASTATPGFNIKIPEQLMTPDKVQTRIGELEFFDGMPSANTVQKVYDNLDFMRGVEAFLSGIPATSVAALIKGMQEIEVIDYNHVMIMDKLLNSTPLFLTGNTDTVYALAAIDMSKEGPMIIEIPAKCGPGTLNDAYFRFVTDMGIPGPDKGAGGKYLILPPDYEGELNPPVGGMEAEVEVAGKKEKVFVSKSTSYVNWLVLRGFLVDGKPNHSANMFRTGLKIYPLSKAENPPKMKFVSTVGKEFNTIHANNYKFYEELYEIVQREPASMWDTELLGLFSAIGIQKGKEFNPDARMKKILTEAVVVGNATARAISFRPRLDGAYLYEGKGWYTIFVGGDYKWLLDKGEGGRNLDARTLYFYQATVNTPAMVLKMVGKGSQYAGNAIDKDGNYLDGSKTYKLTIPANVPAKDFWSVVAYDPQTRSELQTSQPFPSKNNKRDKLLVNENGSVDLYFGPKAPKGKEANWTQTVSGKAWFVLLRLYGPQEPWFDKTWKPGEFELVE